MIGVYVGVGFSAVEIAFSIIMFLLWGIGWYLFRKKNKRYFTAFFPVVFGLTVVNGITFYDYLRSSSWIVVSDQHIWTQNQLGEVTSNRLFLNDIQSLYIHKFNLKRVDYQGLSIEGKDVQLSVGKYLWNASTGQLEKAQKELMVIFETRGIKVSNQLPKN